MERRWASRIGIGEAGRSATMELYANTSRQAKRNAACAVCVRVAGPPGDNPFQLAVSHSKNGGYVDDSATAANRQTPILGESEWT